MALAGDTRHPEAVAAFSSKADAEDFYEGPVDSIALDPPRGEWFITTVHLRRDGTVLGKPSTHKREDFSAPCGIRFDHSGAVSAKYCQDVNAKYYREGWGLVDIFELSMRHEAATSDGKVAIDSAKQALSAFLANGGSPKCSIDWHTVVETPDGRWLCRDLRWTCQKCQRQGNPAASTNCMACGAAKEA